MAAVERAALRIQGLHVHYGASHALQGVDLAVPAGSVTAVLGRNGVGKTTTINAVMGIVPASGGHVYVDDTDLLPLPAHLRRRFGLALVPQGRRLFHSLSVEEHLHLVKPIREEPFSVESILDLFPRLRERLAASAHTLSGGERSMLSIARALVVNPTILLMDEPTEGLAPLLVDSIAETIPLLKDQGLTVLLVEQNLKFALSVADYVAVMDRGSILRVMKRDEVRDLRALSDLILHGEQGE